MAPESAHPAPAQENWRQIACPVCEGTEFSRRFTKNHEHFVTCTGCSLLFINPPPAQRQVVKTYDHAYSEQYAGKADKKLRRCRRWVRRTAQRVRGGRWLDVGCSVGLVVLAATEAGFEGHGVDVEPWALDYARQRLGLTRIRQGLVEEQGYPEGYFHVISLYDVIEHVPDLNRLARELKRILAPAGVIDIITPDLGHWRVPRDLSAWNEIKPSEHLYYFTGDTLGRLLHKHGLRIVTTRFHFKPSLRVYAAHAS